MSPAEAMATGSRPSSSGTSMASAYGTRARPEKSPPLGSTYHYFPEGKQQLAAEAVRYAGDTVARLLRKELDAGPVAGLGAFLALWREIVVKSDFRAGCPVLAVSIEEPPTDEIPPAVAAAAEVFDSWENLLAAHCGSTASRPIRPHSWRHSSSRPSKAPWPCAAQSEAPSPSTARLSNSRRSSSALSGGSPHTFSSDVEPLSGIRQQPTTDGHHVGLTLDEVHLEPNPRSRHELPHLGHQHRVRQRLRQLPALLQTQPRHRHMGRGGSAPRRRPQHLW